jgi:hypothetical protein
MSDNWVTLIPEDPNHIPDAVRHRRARNRFAEILPDADEIEIKVSSKIEFFDSGGNFECIRCPGCGSEIAMDWWKDRMDEDFGDWFKLATYATPCCGTKCTLHELLYDWPQGFGRFALEAMNPNIGELKDRYKRELEVILGSELRVIYRHY